jgi:hypothetical protein
MSGFGSPGFTVLDGTELGTVFVPVEGTSTLYAGSIVCWYRYGVEVIGTAGGHGNLSNPTETPYGIVIAGNNKTKTYGASTYGYAEYTTGTNTAATMLARDFRGAEGINYPKGDGVPLVQVALIDSRSRIRGRLFQGAYGTAPTVAVAASGLSTAGATTSTITLATISYNSYIYCRTGANKGSYRVVNSAHATIHTFAKEFMYTPAVGDTFVFGPRQGANVRIQMDAANQYIDTAGAASTHDFVINVLRTDLSTAGEEYCDFMFSPIHFVGAFAA